MSKTAETYERVTDLIIEQMEKGVVPWRKPWTGVISTPTSLSTGKAYRGINTLILNVAQMARGYTYPLWGTYKQFASMGAQVQRGEKATPVVLWKPMEKVAADGTKDKYLVVRAFSVFNIDQTDAEVPAKYRVKTQSLDIDAGVEAALRYPGGPSVRHAAGDQAFYVPTTDVITLPLREQFKSASDYAATALHEITHSTGHSSRLDRLEPGASFGCATYAQEELVAEIGSAMLASQLNLDVDWPQHAAYVDNWLKVLKGERSLLVKAAQQAQKAVDLVLPAVVAEEEEEAAA